MACDMAFRRPGSLRVMVATRSSMVSKPKRATAPGAMSVVSARGTAAVRPCSLTPAAGPIRQQTATSSTRTTASGVGSTYTAVAPPGPMRVPPGEHPITTPICASIFSWAIVRLRRPMLTCPSFSTIFIQWEGLVSLCTVNAGAVPTTVYAGHPGLGSHYLQATERCGSASSVTIYGTDTDYRYGLVGWVYV